MYFLHGAHLNRLSQNPFAEHDYSGESLVSEASLEIYKYIDQHLVDREDESNVLRSSAAPQCVRRRWHQARGIKGHRMAPRSIVNFLIGDVVEHAVKYLVLKSNVGPGKLYSRVDFGRVTGHFTIQRREFEIHEQIEVRTRLGVLSIVGHLDGRGKRNIDGQWEDIEVKSSGNFGFEKFKEKGPSDYTKQAHSNMLSAESRALGVKETRYFYVHKEKGFLFDRVVQFDQVIADQVILEFNQSMAPSPPQAPYSLTREVKNGMPTGRQMALSFPCGFCPYLNTVHCHNGLKKTNAYGRTVFVKDGRAK